MIDFKDLSHGCCAAAETPLHSKTNWKSDGFDQESGPPKKESKQSESSVVAINRQSKSMSIEDSSVHCASPSKKPLRTKQNIGIGKDNISLSNIIEKVYAVQAGKILFYNLVYYLSRVYIRKFVLVKLWEKNVLY